MIERSFCGQRVYLREGTSDDAVYGATIAGYHVPPSWMPTPASVLDLGANIGLTAIHYQSMWPDASIEAVEMDHDNCIQAMINGVEPLEAAVVATADQDAGYDLGLDAEAFSLGSGLHQPRARYTMAGLCQPSVDFVKMDVEGTEWAILEQSDWSVMVKHLIVELHGPDPVMSRLVGAAKLAALGFNCEPSTHPAGVFAWRD